MFPPQLCHFCGEPITKMTGHDSESLCNHHITYIPEVIVPTHFGCHQEYHNTHPDHPKNPEAEYRKRFIENLDDNILCHFCNEPITKLSGFVSDSLTIHSLDGNHDNWDPDNKVPAHRRCHSRYHMENMKKWVGDSNPMKRPEVRAKHLESVGTPKNRAVHSERMKGNNNPMKDPEVAARVAKTLTGRPHSEEHNRKLSEAAKKAAKDGWIKRRKRYPPTGTWSKEERQRG